MTNASCHLRHTPAADWLTRLTSPGRPPRADGLKSALGCSRPSPIRTDACFCPAAASLADASVDLARTCVAMEIERPVHPHRQPPPGDPLPPAQRCTYAVDQGRVHGERDVRQ
jgi:hypothetical protein